MFLLFSSAGYRNHQLGLTHILYFLYPANSRSPDWPVKPDLNSSNRIGFRTESEAVDHACRLLEQGLFVAAIERPNGTLIAPREIAERCNPLDSMNKRAS
jgi:hypothetical protein